MSDPVDELVLREMREYGDRTFNCITMVERKSQHTESEFEREKLKEWKKSFKPLSYFFKNVLGTNVERVEVSTRLAGDPETPVVISHVEGSASANLERYSQVMNRNNPSFPLYTSRRVLEINPANSLSKRMNEAVRIINEK